MQIKMFFVFKASLQVNKIKFSIKFYMQSRVECKIIYSLGVEGDKR